jgi:hypothetical protein
MREIYYDFPLVNELITAVEIAPIGSTPVTAKTSPTVKIPRLIIRLGLTWEWGKP